MGGMRGSAAGECGPLQGPCACGQVREKGKSVQDRVELLKNNPYPGRGIVVGKDVVYYFIMGNGQNKAFCVGIHHREGDFVMVVLPK